MGRTAVPVLPIGLFQDIDAIAHGDELRDFGIVEK
jgi:hypothetical protein